MSTADLTIGGPERVELAAGTEPGDPAASWAPDDVTTEAPEVPEDVIRAILKGMGHAVACTPSVGGRQIAYPEVKDHWEFTRAELDGMTPPLTRMVNAQPALRRALANGDYYTVGLYLAGYVSRNLTAAQIAQAARDAQEEADGDRQREAEVDPGSDPGSGRVDDGGIWATAAQGEGLPADAGADR